MRRRQQRLGSKVKLIWGLVMDMPAGPARLAVTSDQFHLTLGLAKEGHLAWHADCAS